MSPVSIIYAASTTPKVKDITSQKQRKRRRPIGGAGAIGSDTRQSRVIVVYDLKPPNIKDAFPSPSSSKKRPVATVAPMPNINHGKILEEIGPDDSDWEFMEPVPLDEDAVPEGPIHWELIEPVLMGEEETAPEMPMNKGSGEGTPEEEGDEGPTPNEERGDATDSKGTSYPMLQKNWTRGARRAERRARTTTSTEDPPMKYCLGCARDLFEKEKPIKMYPELYFNFCSLCGINIEPYDGYTDAE